MWKEYCKYCGLELENGMCTCRDFLNAVNNKVYKEKICDTCKRKIDEVAIFCPYCGIPQNIDGNIKKLQDELKGANAKDVIEVYENEDRERGIKKRKFEFTPIITVVLSVVIVVLSLAMFILPMVRRAIDNYKMKKFLEAAEEKSSELILNPTSNNVVEYKEQVEQTNQPVIELKDAWIKRDGFFYAFDENGDPVIDDWVTEIDESGNEQKYYFDIDGKLVVNSWIEGEYYVGSDGAMYANQLTPDGAFVDEKGKVVVKGIETDEERKTYVYYEPSNVNEIPSATNQISAMSGEIKGVDSTKEYPLYVKSLTQKSDVITKGDLRCNITYYMPIIAGKDERELNKINTALIDSYESRVPEIIKSILNNYNELPRSITLNTVNQRNVTSTKITMILEGRLLPRKGLTEKKKIRFVYDRKSAKLLATDISD